MVQVQDVIGIVLVFVIVTLPLWAARLSYLISKRTNRIFHADIKYMETLCVCERTSMQWCVLHGEEI